jgi:hypothetical protein
MMISFINLNSFCSTNLAFSLQNFSVCTIPHLIKVITMMMMIVMMMILNDDDDNNNYEDYDYDNDDDDYLP